MTTDQSVTLPIEGMRCEHCAEHVTGAFEEVDSVAEANVDRDATDATVIPSENVSRDRVAEAVDEAGYQVPTDA